MKTLTVWTKGSLLSIFCILFAICPVSFSVDLSPNGGYNLVIAIEDRSIPQVDEYRYIQNIQTSLQVFSNQLWKATRNQFFINSVQVLIPSNWTISSSEISASHSFQNADFRVSSSVTYPRAENPNLCGLPGKFVELPLGFFNTANSNDFGPIWKTLMVLFARFRFGVWEGKNLQDIWINDEHGFVGDEKFPYFHQNFTSKAWEVTGCSNEPIVGNFLNAVNMEECTVDWSSSPAELNSCRFVPDKQKNKATSSLMHLHWMDSVVEFCDNATHNKFAENKQNMFCDHKSVMEVIRSTPDYKAVMNPVQQVSAIKFQVVKQPSKPIFYLLLDRGLIQGSLEIARLLPQNLASFFSSTTVNRNRTENIAAIGSYPSNQMGRFIQEEVGWSPIGKNLTSFLTAVGNLKINGPLQRDFSRAILEVAAAIKERYPPHGAVILVVKYGADLDNLINTAPEAEVITALNEQNIVLHSIELASIGTGSSRSHLAQVARATHGTYTTLSTLGDAPTAINNVLNTVHNFLNAEGVDLRTNQRTIVKNKVPSSSMGFQIQVPNVIGNQTNMEVFYTSDKLYTQADFQVNTRVLRFSRTSDWNVVQNNTRFTYRFTVSTSAGVNNVVFRTVNCTANVTCDGAGSVIARTNVDVTSPVANNVEVEVSTSSNIVDLSSGNPLDIFVKVFMSGHPVGNVEVIAAVTNQNTSVTESEQLHDDGISPDVMEGDGIYGAGIAPSADGSYKISITIKNTSPNSRFKVKALHESSLGRLLPIDQGATAGCEAFGNCTMETVQGNFMQVVDVQNPVVFAESAKFAPAPGKTFSLLFFQNNLRWFAPRIPGRSNIQASSYEIRKASTRQQLQEDFDNCDRLISTLTPGRPGTFELFRVPQELSTTFYAIKSVYNNVKSERSNIVGFQTEATVEPTEPTTTGTGTPVTGQTNSPTTTTGTGTPATDQTESSPTGQTESSPTGQTESSPTGPTEPSTTAKTGGSQTLRLEQILITAFIGGLHLILTIH